MCKVSCYVVLAATEQSNSGAANDNVLEALVMHADAAWHCNMHSRQLCGYTCMWHVLLAACHCHPCLLSNSASSLAPARLPQVIGLLYLSSPSVETPPLLASHPARPL